MAPKVPEHDPLPAALWDTQDHPASAWRWRPDV